jgi:hypothetical protein
MNGLSRQDEATYTRDGKALIGYPFKSFEGNVTFTREQWGKRVFDINKVGVANYGPYADWLQALRVSADSDRAGEGTALMTDLLHGTEAYLEMWERAVDVKPTRCLPPHQIFDAAGLGRHAIALRDSPSRLLLRTGQPWSRPGWFYRYCVGGAGGKLVSAVSSPSSRTVALITSTAPGMSAGLLAPGSPEALLRGRARELQSGLWLGPVLRGGARYVYGTAGGRISFVGVGTAAATSRLQLEKAVRSIGL